MEISDPTATFKVWDAPLRLFHWLLALTITIAFLSSETDSPLASWHMVAGWCAAVLLVFRIVWGFIGGEHARFAVFIRPSALMAHVRELMAFRAERTVGHNPLGGMAVIVLLGLTAVVLGSGMAAAAGSMGEDLHETLAYGLLALIGIHVGAVLLMSRVTHENLIRAMVSGRKKSDLHSGAADARTSGVLAMLVGAATIVAAVIVILEVEPSAFTPQQRDAHHVERD